MEITNEKELVEAAQLFLHSNIDFTTIEDNIRSVLNAVGEDVNREGLLRTPERVARSYQELLEGYRVDPIALLNDALF